MEIITKSSAETKELGQKLAASLIEGKRNAFTVGLIGELGAGKTTFIQGFAEGLGIKQRIISPTFILLRKYDIPNDTSRFKSLYHVDLYRIEDNIDSEARNLGLTSIWEKGGNVALIEWAEKIGNIMPKTSYAVKFEILDNSTRKISVPS